MKPLANKGPELRRTTLVCTNSAVLRLVETRRQARLEVVEARTHICRAIAFGVHRNQLRTPARLWVQAQGYGADWPTIAARVGWHEASGERPINDNDPTGETR